MKIDGTLNIPQLQGVQPANQQHAATSAQPQQQSDSVQLSDSARWVQDLQESTAGQDEVRLDMVEQAKADIASGSLGSDDDLNAAVDAILAGF